MSPSRPDSLSLCHSLRYLCKLWASTRSGTCRVLVTQEAGTQTLVTVCAAKERNTDSSLVSAPEAIRCHTWHCCGYSFGSAVSRHHICQHWNECFPQHLSQHLPVQPSKRKANNIQVEHDLGWPKANLFFRSLMLGSHFLNLPFPSRFACSSGIPNPQFSLWPCHSTVGRLCPLPAASQLQCCQVCGSCQQQHCGHLPGSSSR